MPWCHVYPEAPVSTPDSRGVIVHRKAGPHGGPCNDPEHQYFLCRFADGGELVQLTAETGAVGPAIAPDGAWCYYFVDETETNGGRFHLHRVRLDGTARERMLTIDAPLPGTPYRASRVYPLTTVSSDGKKLTSAVFLGDGLPETVDYGLLVFDLEACTANVVLRGPTYCNLHPQYCLDPEHPRDIMIQENHGNQVTPDGGIVKTNSPPGPDIHLVRDDGSGMRSFPWGRDGMEACQGHQCWRGANYLAVSAMGGQRGRHLIESPPAPFHGHNGAENPDGVRNVLSRDVENPQFVHFGIDRAGMLLAADYDAGESYHVRLARFGDQPGDPLRDWRFLVDTGSAVHKDSHVHPFPSPDGRVVFFNSNESGPVHAYMVTGFAE